MSVINVKVDDRLDGVPNFLPWKTRLILLLKEQELREVVSNPPLAPVQTSSGSTPVVVEPAIHATWDKKDIKA
jgi:hypothetical protein